MEKQYTVSVIVLCYNYGHLLNKALEACAAQTFRDFEIMMVNNGSTDNTEQVYSDFCQRHPDIRTTYVPIFPNQGIAYGWNSGMKNARSEYVMFHDADDWMDPECLEKMVEKARETDADRIVAQYREVSSEGKLLRDRPFPKSGKDGEHQMPFGMLQGVIFRRSVLLENAIKIPEGDDLGAHDWWLNWEYMLVENGCAFVRQTLYNYYYNPKSVLVYQLRKGSSEQYYSKFARTSLLMLGGVLRSGKGTDSQRKEMEYLYIKLYYIVVLTAFQRYPYKETKEFYRRVHALMLEYEPGYLRHPWLWPFGNGYEFSISFVMYILSLCERIHAVWLIRLAGLASRFTINLR